MFCYLAKYTITAANGQLFSPADTALCGLAVPKNRQHVLLTRFRKEARPGDRSPDLRDRLDIWYYFVRFSIPSFSLFGTFVTGSFPVCAFPLTNEHCAMKLPSQYSRWYELISILVERNLKIRYKGSVLGFFWSLLTPGATILMYAIFAKILKFNGGQSDYLQFLVCGILVWQFTAGTLNDSLYAIAGNANLVKKVYFPRIILPITTVFANGVNFLLTIIPLLIYLAVTHTLDLSNAFWLVPAVVFHLLLCMGISAFVSTANVYFRDTQHMVGIGQLAWFFLTPVFYDVSMQMGVFSENSFFHPGIVFLNPMTGILSFYRRGLMNADLLPTAVASISPAWVWLSPALCVAVFLLGLFTLNRGNRGFGDVL